ncbi:MAG: Gfo/Idh/MocA family oxidoreductase [Hyphomicrobiales bacterium]|nr:Gfo/Idh/MocA family oxidoreductase [Hyphomicrobiales bacterium]
MIRVAAIGHGDIAHRRHFPELQQLAGRAELVAVAGRDPGRLAATAKAFGVPRTYSDVEKMFAEDGFNAVLVLTPPDSHAAYCQLAIETGKHVLVEKPLVGSLQDALDLLNALRKRQQVAPVTFFPLPHVETTEFRTVARLIETGAIGKATSLECHVGHRGPTHASWFYRHDLAGGGVLLDLGIYQVSAAAALFGPASRMSALCSRCFDQRVMDDGSTVAPDVEDSALVNLWFDDRIAATVNANWNGFLSHHHTRLRGIAIGREGILQFGVADNCIYVHRADGQYKGELEETEQVDFDGYPSRRLPVGPATAEPSIMETFINRIEAGDSDTRLLEIQVHVMEILLNAYRDDGPDVGRLTTGFAHRPANQR